MAEPFHRDTLFFRNTRLTALLIGLILVAGLMALQSLARQEDPTIARRFGRITTFYPGARALRVESLVSEPIEERILELHEVKHIDSVSRTGVSIITVELDDAYQEADVDEIWSKVRDKLADAAAELPAGVLPPEFEDRTSTAVTLLAALVWEQPGPPQLDLLSRLADELENQLRTLPGTKETEVFGRAQEEVRVSVDPLALAAVGLTAADVSRALGRADSKVPAGQLRHRTNDLLLEVEGELTHVERIRNVPLRREVDGRLLRVGDIARVEKTVREPAESSAWIAGRPAVAVAATMESDRRVDHWAQRARAALDAFRSEVPTGIGLEIAFDQSRYVDERLGRLVQNLVLGISLVMAVLLFLMGWRSALLVASALPLTLLAVLAELRWLGVPLHQMSVTGLIIALGLLIDNAIVVVDEYNKRVAAGAAPGEAVRGSVRLLFVPLAASTLTTVLAFLPIVLMPGGAGEFVGPIAIGVGLAVTTSFALAMTVIPAVAGRLGTGAERRRRASRWWRDGYSSPRLTMLYRRSLHGVLRRPALGVAASVALPLLGFAVGTTLPEQFFPANDRDQFQVQLHLPPQSSLRESEAGALRARELIEAHPEVVESHWFVGETAPRVFYNMFSSQAGLASYAGGFVTTLSPRATEKLLPALQAELTAALPEARVLALPFEQGPPFDAPIEVRIVGPDLEELRRLGESVRGLLAESRAVTYTHAGLAGGAPMLELATDEDEARMAGLELSDIADQLNAGLEGALGGSVLEANQELPVRVRVDGEARASLAAIAAERVLPPDRAAEARPDAVPGVPLSALAEFELVPELAGVPRHDGERTNTVQAFLVPYALIADALAEFRARLAAAKLTLPPGYRLEFGGETERRQEAMGKLLLFALPLFVVMAGSIILSFDSFRMAGIIFVVAFLSIGLALLGIWLFGYPLGFLSIVGAMGLVGLAINGAIVVLTALREDPRANAGHEDATVDVVVDATRHIAGTTLTTIGGFVPLIAFGGRFWPPMATAIAGGVAGCAVLALYLVPVLFAAMRRRDRRRAAPPLRDLGAAPGPDAAVAS